MNAKKYGIIAATLSAMIGISGAVATSAHADGVNWSAIAQCESGNDWSINTGNGYYGGLQFSESTWIAEGGQKYAAYPNEASESEQIAIASGMSLSNWPVCGARAGSSGSYSAQTTSPTYKTYKAVRTPYRAPVQKAIDYGTPACPDWLNSYKVKAGDSLSSIAREDSSTQTTITWEEIYNDNLTVIGSNPNLIYTGQYLCVPLVKNSELTD